jgi:hypothetical protein
MVGLRSYKDIDRVLVKEHQVGFQEAEGAISFPQVEVLVLKIFILRGYSKLRFVLSQEIEHQKVS